MVKCFRCLQEVPDDAEVCPYCGQILKPILKIDKSQILDPSTLKEGDVIKDRFEIRENLGSGGIGTVFKVYDTKFDVISVIKMLNREFCEDQDIRNRFFEEHKKVLEVDHENLVKYFELDEFKGVPFVVIQYVDGINLRRIINAKKNKKPPFSLKEIFPIFDGIAKALSEIHKTSFHGDLKPENVIITASGIKVTDYAISRVLAPQDFVSIQLALGDAYYYLSPEYITDPSNINFKVDIYALGVILYELLTGIIPKAEPASPSSMVQGLPVDIDVIVLKALNKNPDERYCCIEEFHYQFAKVTGQEEKLKYLLPEIDRKKKESTQLKKEKKEEAAGKKEKKVEEKPGLLEEETGERREDEGKKPRRELLFEDELVEEEKQPVIEEKKEKKSSLAVVIMVLLLLAGIGAGAFVVLNSKNKKSPAAAKVAVTTKEVKKKVSVKKVRPVRKGVEKKASAKTSVTPAKANVTRGKESQKLISNQRKVVASKPITVEKAKNKEQKNQQKVKQKEAKKGLSPKEEKKVAVAKTAHCPPGMVYIPPGYFDYGSPPNDPFKGAFDRYFGKTYLKGYCIDKYEYPDKKGVIPMSRVNYTRAYNLCKQQGKRLCTEPEWEKACKGPSNFLFPFGNSFSMGKCNTVEAGKNKLMPSGSFSECKSAYGVYDMCGNLLEWTATPFQGNFFITKGGSYLRTKGDSRCSARRPKPYYRQSKDLGFRCCKDANY